MVDIEVVTIDELGRKARVNCTDEDTIAFVKKNIAAQTGSDWTKLQLKKWSTIYKDQITLKDYEVSDGMILELYGVWPHS